MSPERELAAAGAAVATNAYTPPARRDDAGLGLLAACALGVLLSATVIAVIVAAAWSKVGAP